MGFEQEEPLGIPYEPTMEDRALLAIELRRELVAKLGLEYVVRFNGSQRYRSPIPTGEALLRHTSVEHCGTFGGYRWFRASVHLSCHAPDGGINDKDPYRDTVELRLRDERYQEHTSYDDPYAPPFETDRSRKKTENNVATIALLTAALIVGGIISESRWGTVTAMQKKFRSWCDMINDMTEERRHTNRPSTSKRH